VPDRDPRPLSTGHAESDVAGGVRPFGALARDIGHDRSDNPGWIAAADNAQFERDVAAIEQATATLRRGEPALQSWTESPMAAASPRPLWLVVGMLWFSTALVTVSAVFAIYVLVG